MEHIDTETTNQSPKNKKVSKRSNRKSIALNPDLDAELRAEAVRVGYDIERLVEASLANVVERLKGMGDNAATAVVFDTEGGA